MKWKQFPFHPSSTLFSLFSFRQLLQIGLTAKHFRKVQNQNGFAVNPFNLNARIISIYQST